MHYRYIGFSKLNDHYEEGVEFIRLNSKNNKERSSIRKLKIKIKIKDFLARIKLLS